MRWTIPLLSFTLACESFEEKIEDVKDEYGEITNDFMVAGSYLGIDETQTEATITDFMSEEMCLVASEGESFDLSAFSEANQAMIFLTETDISGDLFTEDISEKLADATPISFAEVLLSSENGALNDFHIPETDESGLYKAGAAEEFVYVEDNLQFLMKEGVEEHSLKITAPAAPEILASISKDHPVGQGVNIDLSGQGYDSGLVMVFRIPLEEGQDPQVTHSNINQNDPLAMFELSHPSDSLLNKDIEELQGLEIPGEAFPEEGIYGIAAAGLKVSSSEGMQNINLISAMVAGKFTFTPVCAPDCETVKLNTLCSDQVIQTAYNELAGQYPDLDGDGVPDPPPLDAELRNELCETIMTEACQE